MSQPSKVQPACLPVQHVCVPARLLIATAASAVSPADCDRLACLPELYALRLLVFVTMVAPVADRQDRMEPGGPGAAVVTTAGVLGGEGVGALGDGEGDGVAGAAVDTWEPGTHCQYLHAQAQAEPKSQVILQRSLQHPMRLQQCWGGGHPSSSHCRLLSMCKSLNRDSKVAHQAGEVTFSMSCSGAVGKSHPVMSSTHSCAICCVHPDQAV